MSPGILKIRVRGHSSRIRSLHLSPPPLNWETEKGKGKKGHNVSCFFLPQRNLGAVLEVEQSHIDCWFMVISWFMWIIRWTCHLQVNLLELTCGHTSFGSHGPLHYSLIRCLKLNQSSPINFEDVVQPLFNMCLDGVCFLSSPMNYRCLIKKSNRITPVYSITYASNHVTGADVTLPWHGSLLWLHLFGMGGGGGLKPMIQE